jgi:hypothetical protein
MSDQEAPTTNSGGRKARPYDGQGNPFCRAGFIPARKEAIVPLILALESLNLDFNMLPKVWFLIRIGNLVVDAPFDAEILLTWQGTIGI